MDNENLQKRIDEFEKRLSLLERADNIDSLKYWREKLSGRVYGDSDSSVTNTINFTVDTMSGDGSIDALDFPDGYIDFIRPNGERVRVPYYSLSRF